MSIRIQLSQATVKALQTRLQQAYQKDDVRLVRRITAHRLPSYSPDYNPIEYLWKKTKQRGTHNKYFKEFAALTVSVEETLAYFATHADEVLCLFGRYCEESKLDLQQAA